MQKAWVNGMTLAYDRRGRGEPLLLIHGFPLDHTIWEPLAVRLVDNFDVIMPDLRGFGLSDIPAGEYTIEQMASDLAQLLDVLKIQKTYIAGHSMGGYVALAFAHAYPDRVSGLGLLGSQALPDSSERKAIRFAQVEQVAENGVQVVAGMADNLSASPQFAPIFRAIILQQRPAGVIGALKALAIRPDATQFVALFNFPIVLVHGLADALIPPARASELKTLLPQAFLTELQAVGHSPMLEAPDQTALALLQLLAR